MKFQSFLRTPLVALLLVSLPSCAVKHDPQIAAARDGVLSTKKTYLQGALIGAAGGAVAGAIIGNQSHKKRGTEQGAVAGAIVGLIAGLTYAHHVVLQRQYYASTSAYLKDCIRAAEAEKTSVEKYNATLARRRSVVRKDEALVRGTLQDSHKVQDSLEKEIALQETALANARAENASSQQLSRQQRHINALKAEERRLTAHMDRLGDYPKADSMAGQGNQ